MNFIRPLPNKVDNPHYPQRLKLLIRLQVGLSHLHDHKFKYNFLDTINPLCSCGSDMETISDFFLYCPNFLEETANLLNKTSEINSDISIVKLIVTYNDFKMV